MGVLEVTRVKDAGGGISSLLMLVSLSFVFIHKCMKRMAVPRFPSKSPDNHLYRMAYKSKLSGPCH